MKAWTCLALLLGPALALARPAPLPDLRLNEAGQAPLPLGRERADTLFLFAAEGAGSYGSPGTDSRGFTFDHAGGPAAAGWTGVDRMLQESFWQVADTELCAGTGTDMSAALPFDADDAVNDFALWCGRIGDACDPNDYDGGASWVDPDGYGNRWHQYAVLALGDQSAADSILVSFAYRTDFEGGDYDYLELASRQGDAWVTHWTEQRPADRTFREATVAIAATELESSDLRLAFYFHSDAAWSDEDGYIDSDLGAVWLDNLRVAADATDIFAADFEDGLQPSALSYEVEATAGEFAQLRQGLFQGAADPVNASFVWSFFDEETPANGAPGYDFGLIEGPPYLANQVQSPPLSVDASGEPFVLTEDTQVLLAFDVYLDLPLAESVFYSWDVKPLLADSVECIGSFSIEQTLYWGTPQAWQTVVFDATLLVDLWSYGQLEGVEALVAELRVLDLAGVYGAAGQVRNQAPYFDNVRVMLVEEPTGVETAPALSTRLVAYPNPFNPSTTLRLHQQSSGRASLQIFDIAGRAIRTLLDGPLAAGSHERIWDGRDDAGRRLASGVYFARFESGEGRDEEKLILLK